MTIEIRPISEDEIPVYRHTMMNVFGGDATTDALGDERLRALVPRGRTFAAFDGKTMVATTGTYDFELTVPGGTLPMAGLTQVAVRPTHRRRGILRGLIAAHLEEARGRRVPVSGLWASEASIYGRFGYGIAAEADDLQLTAPGLELRGEGGDEIEPLDDPEPAALPPVYDEVRLARPGMLTRSPAWWHYRRFRDRSDLAKGASPRRNVLARRGGAAVGSLTYRHRPAMEHGSFAGSVEIEELLAVDARAELSLWRFACAMDLFPKVTFWNAPVDSILPWAASDARRVRRRRTDTLWLRIDDVPATLAARRYADDGVLAIELEGTVHELRVEGGAARCAPGAGPADLRVDRASLGSLYLGGVPARLLARAGLVAGSARAVERADRMFASAVAPWCAEVF